MPSPASSDRSILTRQQVDNRLQRPPAKNLDTASWRAARPALIDMVTAMQPTSEAAAVRFHSHLCDFLRRSAWTAGTDLNWQALLTSHAVDRHRDEQARETQGNSLITNHRSTLHRAQRALAGERPDARPARTAPSAPAGVGEADRAARQQLSAAATGTGQAAVRLRSSFQRAVRRGVVDQPGLPASDREALLAVGMNPERLARLTLDALLAEPCPLIDAAAAFAPHAVVTDARLDSALRRLAACAGFSSTGTVGDVHALRMWSAVARSLLEVVVSEISKPAKRPSGRAALQRAAQAELDALAARADLLDPERPLPPELTLPADVRDKIVNWTPAKHNKITGEAFAPVRPLLVRLLLASEPETSQKAARLCLHLAGFLIWAGARHPGGPAALRAPDLWDDQLRQDYRRHQLTAPAGASTTVGSADTARSEIGWVLHRARPAARREPSPQRTVAAPYTPSEAARVVRQARNQPTAALRRSLSFTIALALGAGLDGQDLRYVRRSDITERVLDSGQTVLVVRVTHPDNPREVVVLAAYEHLLREALDLHGRARLHRKALVIGEKPSRKNITGPVKARARTGTGDALDLDVGRMRKHWLVTVMSAAVPLDVLLGAAGLTSTRALTDLLPFLSPPDPERVHEVIRAATDRMLAAPDAAGPVAAAWPTSQCTSGAGVPPQPAVPDTQQAQAARSPRRSAASEATGGNRPGTGAANALAQPDG